MALLTEVEEALVVLSPLFFAPVVESNHDEGLEDVSSHTPTCT
jgi:hypothetical protein